MQLFPATSIFHLHIFHHFAGHLLPLRLEYEILFKTFTHFFSFLQNCELVNDQPRNGVTPSSSRAREETLQLYENFTKFKQRPISKLWESANILLDAQFEDTGDT